MYVSVCEVVAGSTILGITNKNGNSAINYQTTHLLEVTPKNRLGRRNRQTKGLVHLSSLNCRVWAGDDVKRNVYLCINEIYIFYN